MRRFAQLFAVVVGFLPLAAPCWGQDKKAESAAAKKQSKVINSCDFSKEFKALEEGAELLAGVHDEKEAKKVARKLCSMFNLLPVPMGGTNEQLDAWAVKANQLNFQMERLRKEKWFVSSGLQEAWTLATDPFSRRRAQK